MSILARMKARQPELGYATDFVTMVMKPLAREIADKRIRVVTNAGGVNPQACRDALAAVLREAGVDLKIAVVEGDDLLDEAEQLSRRRRARDVLRRAAAGTACQRQRLSRRLSDRRRARRRRRHRADRALRRFGRRARPADPRIRLEGTPTTTCSRRAASPATSSNAARRPPAAFSPTGGRLPPTGTAWAFPIAECRADGSFEITKPRRHRRPRQPGDRRPSRSSTRSAIPRPMFCPTSSATGRM